MGETIEENELARVNVKEIKMERPISSTMNSRGVSVTPSGDAIVIRNAHKSYRSGYAVLKGLDMTVPCGSIYGLLGSSGCGKTTLLSCIVGIKKLDQGQIRIFGELPANARCVGVPGKNIGYMPQEISLYEKFSIEETLNYFGTINGMKKNEIVKSGKFFQEVLNLPNYSTLVEQLSGGQQRRVSLVAALIGEPELLILDEPTVGVDPLIRESVWSYLKQVATSKRTTVMITTHYIEECRDADNVGIMRNGVLIAERPPKTLYREYNSNNLEKIVLELARTDNQGSGASSSNLKANKKQISGAIPLNVPFAKVMNKPTPGIKDALFRVRALTLKNIIMLVRSPLLTFLELFVAAFFVMLVCIGLGQDPKNLQFGLINEEVIYPMECSNISNVAGECFINLISCRFLQQLKPDAINLEVFDSETQAMDAVRAGHIWGYLYFQKQFSESFYERVFVRNLDDDFTFNNSRIILRLDESNKQVSTTIKVAVIKAFQEFLSNMLSNCGFGERQGDSSLQYHDPIFGNDTTDFREFVAPGVVVLMLFFFPTVTTSIRYISEKKSGVMHRSIVSGVETWEIMTAYSIAEVFVLLLQVAINWILLYYVFQIDIQGSHALLLAIFFLCGCSGVCLGFLFGSAFMEEIQAALLAMAVFFPNTYLCGIVWPVEGMAIILQYVTLILPCTLPAEAARSIISRGWGFNHPNVWPGVVVLLFYSLGVFIATILFHRVVKK